jgi:hypothetical protein
MNTVLFESLEQVASVTRKAFTMTPTFAQLPPFNMSSTPSMIVWLTLLVILAVAAQGMIRQSKDREEKRRAEARLRTIEKKLDALIEQNKQDTSV